MRERGVTARVIHRFDLLSPSHARGGARSLTHAHARAVAAHGVAAAAAAAEAAAAAAAAAAAPIDDVNGDANARLSSTRASLIISMSSPLSRARRCSLACFARSHARAVAARAVAAAAAEVATDDARWRAR
jgi:hypothetical protein